MKDRIASLCKDPSGLSTCNYCLSNWRPPSARSAGPSIIASPFRSSAYTLHNISSNDPDLSQRPRLITRMDIAMAIDQQPRPQINGGSEPQTQRRRKAAAGAAHSLQIRF
jgi:hypothetical protein